MPEERIHWEDLEALPGGEEIGVDQHIIDGVVALADNAHAHLRQAPQFIAPRQQLLARDRGQEFRRPVRNQVQVVDHIEQYVDLNLYGFGKDQKKSPKVDFWDTKVEAIWGCQNPEGPYKPDAFLETNSQWVPSDPYKFTEPKQLVGIEVEVENLLKIDPNLELCFWRIKGDGSLRNNGREFITWAVPLRYIESAFNQLFLSINKDADFSERTSIHVHLDVRQCTASQIYGLIFTYSVFENLLFKFASINRRKSIYCVPITETSMLSALDNSGHIFSANLNTYWSKYSALNILPLQPQGTLEFRQMPGHNNIKKLLIWVDMLTKLKIFAYKYPLIKILDMICQLNTNSQYHQFVELVFGSLTEYLDTSNLLSDMEKPVFTVKNSAISNKFHQYVINTLNKNSQLYTRLYPILDLTDIQRNILKQMAKAGGGNYVHMDERSLIETIKSNSSGWRSAFPKLMQQFEQQTWPE